MITLVQINNQIITLTCDFYSVICGKWGALRDNIKRLITVTSDLMKRISMHYTIDKIIITHKKFAFRSMFYIVNSVITILVIPNSLI